MSLEDAINRFCSRSLVKREQHENEITLKDSVCSQSSRCSQKELNTTLVSCNDCIHFVPDKIGDGAGIGDCSHGIAWTQGSRGPMPLFRYASRYCDKFSPLEEKGDAATNQ